MDLTASMQQLKRAGACAVAVNAPMGSVRFAELAGRIAATRPGTVTDLGCGLAAFLRAVAALARDARCIGIEQDSMLASMARKQAADEGLGQRVEIRVDDASKWSGPADCVVVIGADHAFGGATQTLSKGRRLVAPGGRLLLGSAVWESAPSRALEAQFGDLPKPHDFLGAAQEHGWNVEALALSTQAEWDAFESAWIAGVRAVGSDEALAFADRREASYRNGYRGVLGFAWLEASSPR